MTLGERTIIAAVVSAALALGATGVASATQDRQATPVGSEVCRSMGGLGNYNYAEDGRSGVAAMAGAFRGGVYFRQIGEFRDVGDGRSEGEFEHMFVTEDGSTIHTRDQSWGVAVPGTDYIVGGAAYTVVKATGQFEGYTGTFHSWGTFAPTKGQAILRYEGQICRLSAS